MYIECDLSYRVETEPRLGLVINGKLSLEIEGAEAIWVILHLKPSKAIPSFLMSRAIDLLLKYFNLDQSGTLMHGCDICLMSMSFNVWCRERLVEDLSAKNVWTHREGDVDSFDVQWIHSTGSVSGFFVSSYCSVYKMPELFLISDSLRLIVVIELGCPKDLGNMTWHIYDK